MRVRNGIIVAVAVIAVVVATALVQAGRRSGASAVWDDAHSEELTHALHHMHDVWNSGCGALAVRTRGLMRSISKCKQKGG